MLFLGYLGARASFRVLGRWNDTLYRVLRFECECAPWSAAFLAALALDSLEPEPGENLAYENILRRKQPTLGGSLALGGFCGGHCSSGSGEQIVSKRLHESNSPIDSQSIPTPILDLSSPNAYTSPNKTSSTPPASNPPLNPS